MDKWTARCPLQGDVHARALGIPAVSGIADATRLIKPGMPVLVNGQTGEVVLEPKPEQLRTAITDKQDYDRISKNSVSEPMT